MPLYLCRWPNGDFSFASGVNKVDAIESLDEIGNAEGCPLYAVGEFMVHFRLADEGTYEFEGFGEATEDAMRKAYPLLEQAVNQILEDDPSFELQHSRTRRQERVIADAVQRERQRVRPKKVSQPETQVGSDIKRVMDAPTSMIDREIRKEATETLRKLKPKGKPN